MWFSNVQKLFYNNFSLIRLQLSHTLSEDISGFFFEFGIKLEAFSVSDF